MCVIPPVLTQMTCPVTCFHVYLTTSGNFAHVQPLAYKNLLMSCRSSPRILCYIKFHSGLAEQRLNLCN